MKRFSVCLCALALLVCLFCAGVCEQEAARREVIYFYENYCESCSPAEDFREHFRSLTGVSLEECDYTAHNIARSDGQTALAEAEMLYGLENPNIPMVIVDGSVYCGAAEMESLLAQDALAWGSTDSTIVLLTGPACADIADVLESLPESVVLRRGILEIESEVVCEIIDIGAQPEFAAQLFDAYCVPEEQRAAPCAFYADRYLSGAEAIEKNLAAEVELGWAAGGVKLPAADAPLQE